MKEHEKAKLTHDTIKAFFDQIGDDSHAVTLLKVLTEGLYNEETLLVLGETGQTGDQVDHTAQGGEGDQVKSDGSENTGSTEDVEESDREGDLRQ